MSSSGELYRQKAAQMRAQAARAETSDLRTVYEGIAEDWDREADSDTVGPADGNVAEVSPPASAVHRAAPALFELAKVNAAR